MLPTSVTNVCHAGDTWEWDQVHFTFLYPIANNIELGNDSSCVLRIDNNSHRTLLTGDIEKHAEKDLLALVPEQLVADVLVAPHHGSKTSALKAFVSTVHPHVVLYAIGYRNRYHFPHPSVINAYAKISSIQLNTAESGAITFKFERGLINSTPQLYRISHKHYWLD